MKPNQKDGPLSISKEGLRKPEINWWTKALAAVSSFTALDYMANKKQEREYEEPEKPWADLELKD